jgi:hypothetical protein
VNKINGGVRGGAGRPSTPALFAPRRRESLPEAGGRNMGRKWRLMHGWEAPIRVRWVSSDGRTISIVDEGQGAFRVAPSFTEEVRCASFSEAIDIAYRLQDTE